MTGKIYRIDFENAAKKALKKLDRGTQGRIIAAVRGLATNPRPDGVRKLTNRDALYRIRVGDCRVVYQIWDEQLLVLVIRVGSRADVYKNL